MVRSEGSLTPRLIPYTWLRHVVPALVAATAAALAWWVSVLVLELLRQAAFTRGVGWMAPRTEGLVWLSLTSGAVAAAQVGLEGRIEGTWRSLVGVGMAVAAVAAASLTSVGMALHDLIAQAWGMSPASLALRWALVPWLLAGLGAALGPWMVRGGRRLLAWLERRWDLAVLPAPPAPPGSWWAEALVHALSGLAGGCAGALVWYALGHGQGDLFLAAVLGSSVMGAVVGGLAWGIPDRTFQGWVHVLVGARPGWRIPVDAAQVTLSERFVGHFPAGMDLHLPPGDGVDELHLSVIARGEGSWAARGLSRDKVRVMRPLAWVDLSYDPELPAPLETPLHAGDRVALGPEAVVELVVMAREVPP